jgi:VanZ family protein
MQQALPQQHAPQKAALIVLAYNPATVSLAQQASESRTRQQAQSMPPASTAASPIANPRPHASRMLLAVFAYTLLILYGSLFPFDRWRHPFEPLFTFVHVWPAHLDKADMLQNLLVYAPFGLMLSLWLASFMRYLPALVLCTVLGTTLSFSVESLQQFNPARVSSMLDVLMNAIGTASGGMLAALVLRHTLSGAMLMRLRDRYFLHGSMVNTGLVVLGIWILSQTSPLVPTLDVGHLRHALSGLYHTLLAPQTLSMAKTAVYALNVASLGMLTLTLARPDAPALRLFLLTLGFVLASKALVISRVLSLEALLGSGVGFACACLLRRLPRPWACLLGIALAASGFTLSEISPEGGAFTAGFNWIPFVGQMRSFTGLENILELLWPFMEIAVCARLALPRHRHMEAIVMGGLFVTGGVFILEWHQQWVPGRYGDITQVLLCIAGWAIPWMVREDKVS